MHFAVVRHVVCLIAGSAGTRRHGNTDEKHWSEYNHMYYKAWQEEQRQYAQTATVLKSIFFGSIALFVTVELYRKYERSLEDDEEYVEAFFNISTGR